MKTIDKIIKSIFAINSTAQFTFIKEDIDNIEWLDGTTPIAKTDIETKQAKLQTVYDNKKYQRDRVSEYPNLQEAIHALLDGGDTLTELQAKRTAIKTKYPKSGA